MKYFIVSLIWAGYCFIHSYLISTRFTHFLESRLKNYYAFYRLFYVLFSLITLIWLINYSSSIDHNKIIIYSPTLSIIRYILTAGSLLLFFRAFFFDYDCLAFFGIRQIQSFNKDKSNTAMEIKKSGLLGVVRHPMYIALIIYLWCQTFRLIDILVNSILTIYVIIGTILEEKKLILEFGDKYRQYQKEVPMLLPIRKKKLISLK